MCCSFQWNKIFHTLHTLYLIGFGYSWLLFSFIHVLLLYPSLVLNVTKAPASGEALTVWHDSSVFSFIWANQWLLGSHWAYGLTVRWTTLWQRLEKFPHSVNLSPLGSTVADWIQAEHSCRSLWRSTLQTFSFQISRGCFILQRQTLGGEALWAKKRWICNRIGLRVSNSEAMNLVWNMRQIRVWHWCKYKHLHFHTSTKTIYFDIFLEHVF